MELFSLRSPSISRVNSFSSRRASMDKSTFLSGGQTLTFPCSKRCPDARNLILLDFIPRATGYLQGAVGSNLKITAGTKQERNSKDKDLVFVAGSTGKVGSRTVRELLRLGFQVRAGVRSAKKAETLVQSVQQMKFDDLGNSGVQPVEKLEIVECDLENQGKIRPAIGNASIVICCIGASEKEVFDVTGPYRIDYKAAKNLIDAATVARVDHFILLTSLGTNKIGFPAAILNLFWGVLFWKRKAEEALIACGLPYTIVRPGGMERPTDAYKETHNIVLANEDTYFGGQVSNLQVAELMAFMAKHRNISFCKVVEVIAETTAPRTPMEKLLARIPSQRVDRSSFDVLQTKPKSDPTETTSVPSINVVDDEPTEVEEPKTRPLSPYNVYDDLKPPTSPSPNAFTAVHSAGSNSQISSSTTQSSAAQESGDKEDHYKKQNPGPLSPFTMYEDLKPPTSPIPSVPKY